MNERPTPDASAVSDPCTALEWIVAQHPVETWTDANRVRGLLNDLCRGQHKGRVHALVICAQQGVLDELRGPRAWALRESLVPRLSQRLSQDAAMDHAVARWAVETWLSAARQRRLSPGVSIQDFIRDSPEGARILVPPGVYAGTITLHKSVELVADGPCQDVILEMGGRDVPVVLAKAKETALRGLTLRHRWPATPPAADSHISSVEGSDAAVIEVREGTLSVENCDVSSDIGPGVLAEGVAVRLIINQCRIHDTTGEGVILREAAGRIEDCEVRATKPAGIQVSERSDPLVRACRFHDGSGISVESHARGTFEDCELWDQAEISVSDGANPMVTGCRLHEGEISIWEAGGTFERCEIWGAVVAIALKGGSDPTFRGCRIHGAQHGIWVFGSRGTFEACEISGCATEGIQVDDDSEPTVRDCRIHGGKAGIWAQGRGTFEGCEISDTAAAGVWVGGLGESSADPVFRDCRIHSGQGNGIWAQGRGTFEGCEISGNAKAGIRVRIPGDPVFRDCRIRSGKAKGVVVQRGGRGTFERCEISDNAKAGVWLAEKASATFRDCRIDGGNAEGLVVEMGGLASVDRCEMTGNPPVRGRIAVPVDELRPLPSSRQPGKG